MRVDARKAAKILGAIRLFNGAAALFVPGMLLKRLGTDVREDPSGVYPFRMFGIRTVLLGTELLLVSGEDRRRSARLGILIHGSDTVAAAVAGLSGQVPRRVGIMITSISAVNTALAIIAARD